jgi:hypothetical protein
VWGVLSGVVAPATLVTALLFYFGYVSTRAQFRYFGVDVDTLGYTTQEFVMRAPQSLLVPGLTLLLVTAALVWGDGLVRRWLAHAPAATVRRVRGVAGAVGVLLLTAGVALVALYRPLLDWLPYPLVTSLLLGSGALTVERVLAWRPGATGFRVERVLLLLVVLVATLWATATVAERSGPACSPPTSRTCRRWSSTPRAVCSRATRPCASRPCPRAGPASRTGTAGCGCSPRATPHCCSCPRRGPSPGRPSSCPSPTSA